MIPKKVDSIDNLNVMVMVMVRDNRQACFIDYQKDELKTLNHYRI